MYCPKCSQQQISDEMRYCSRCGFPLSGVRELIAGGVALESQADQLSRIKRNVRRGAGMMLLSLPATLVVGLLSAIDDDFALLLFLPLLCFLIGFVRVMYGVFIAEKRAARKRAALLSQSTAEISGQPDTGASRPELSAPGVAPLGSFSSTKAQTAEMVQPPSVTESTTRLLDEESDPRRG